MWLWTCIGNNRTFLTLLQQTWERKKRYVWFYTSFWHYYEETPKLHNNRSTVVITIMWQECKQSIQQNCQRSSIWIFGQSQSGHITSINLTGDVSTMCFTLTRNYTMKTSLQQLQHSNSGKKNFDSILATESIFSIRFGNLINLPFVHWYSNS